MKKEPFKFSEWIKHAYDFERDISPIEYAGNEVLVLAHPSHPKIRLNLDEDIINQVYMLPKSLQLYFFGFVWIGFCRLDDSKEWSIVKKILLAVFDYAILNPKMKKREMVWDDHALSERACVLVYIKKVLNKVDVLNYIDQHLKILTINLDEILDSTKWNGNNHRVFHLCAKWCLEVNIKKDDLSAQYYLDKIEDFFFTLLDLETGLSVEQSVSYYNFDITLLRMVIDFLTSSGKKFRDSGLDSTILGKKKEFYLEALAFPDGELPASGDTPLGNRVKAPALSHTEREVLWRGLERVGHYRGASSNDKYHFHLISHNAESAHGHISPLHIDLWVNKIGLVLIDSGGPYKYGDPLRHEWFRSSKAHNTIHLDANDKILTDSSVLVKWVDTSLKGIVQCESGFFYRSIYTANDFFRVIDKVSFHSSWSFSWHFSFDTDIVMVATGEFDLLKSGEALRLSFSSNINLDFEVCEGYLTYQGGSKVVAPYILVKGRGLGVISTTVRYEGESEYEF